jgi:predicted ferric reductase
VGGTPSSARKGARPGAAAASRRLRAEDGSPSRRRRLALVAMRRRGRLLALAYAGLVLLPLAVVLMGPAPAPRGFVLELGSALGIAALTILLLQLVLPARLRLIGAPIGIDAVLRFHREIGLVALALVVLHLVVVVVDDPGRLWLLMPWRAPARAILGLGALIALAALVGCAMRRGRLPLSYGRRRLVHAVLGVAVLVLSAGHAVAIDRYVTLGREALVLAAFGVAGVVSLVHLHIGRPLLLAARRRYRIERIEAERGGARTLVLRADGHAGHPFRPGQFAWLRLGGSPLRPEDHPFSLSSSAERTDAPEFTIGPLGDFTLAVDAIEPGTVVLLDGPHGAACPSERSRGLVLVAGGIGITPGMSTLRTLADRGDTRSHPLVYGNRTWDGVVFREELDSLSERLDLRVVHVLAEPPEGWSGEQGRVTPELLARHMPADSDRHQHLVCGPPPMIDAVTQALGSLGVPPARVHAERWRGV